MSEKKRLDVLLLDKGLAPSREKAQGLIMSGLVYVEGQKADKCGMQLPDTSDIDIRGKTNPYVSRGGLKLAKAVDCFDLDLSDKICMDAGASTGGFTDCMLQNGAAKVYSVDVGYGQLAWKLRTDPRVINLERTNIRYITSAQVSDSLDFVSVDVSFISLTVVLPAIISLMKDDGQIVMLIKPQFEAGREKVGKKGVVRDKNTHIEVIEKILDFVKNNKLYVLNLDYSPIKGPEGNIEYLLHACKNEHETINDINAKEVVEKSHQ